ncbi:MAG: MBL fold metallo-hydrolase [Candidatus Limnocylindrales bacterium]
MRLDILGAGPAYSDRLDSSGAAYLVRQGGHAVLLDLGQGSFPRLAQALEPSRLDAVVVSHLHPDHFIDLVPLRHYLRWEFEPTRRLRVIAPATIGERLDALLAEPGFTGATFDVEILLPGVQAIGTFELEARRVVHAQDSFGFRLSASQGPGLVYSGDCGRAEDLDALVRAGDTLLCEVSFGPGPVPVDALHLDGPAVGALAARTQAGRVLLTHLQMGFDREATLTSVRARFDGPVDFVVPGDRFAIG